MQLKLKHLFFRIVEHKLFRLALALVFAWWVYQAVWVAKPEFSKNTNVTRLSDAEVEYYARHFDYVMNVGADGQAMAWNTYSSSGEITPVNRFISKSGATCRTFKERYTIGTNTGTAQGFGCKRQDEQSWCKLKPDNAQTCVLEAPETTLGGALRDASEAVDSAKMLVKGTIDFW